MKLNYKNCRIREYKQELTKFWKIMIDNRYYSYLPISSHSPQCHLDICRGMKQIQHHHHDFYINIEPIDIILLFTYNIIKQ